MYRLLCGLFVCFCTLLALPLFPQRGSFDRLLDTKRRFAEMEMAALAEPYEGISTTEGIQQGLFPIRSTGVSTEPIREAAENFLNKLTAKQRTRILFPVEDPEWRRWSNVDNGIYVRQGVSLEEMTDTQYSAALQLLSASLSAKGLKLSQDIMKTEEALRELNNYSPRYGEKKYFLTLMGSPSPTAPWGWQLDGHHLVINYFVLADQVVMTPVFLGGEPVIVESGKYRGTAILQEEQDSGLAFLQSLTDTQREKAILETEKGGNRNLAEAHRDNLTIDYVGLPGSELSEQQRRLLLDLIRLFVGNMKDSHARVRMDEVERHLDETYFAWIGATDPDAVFYYRIHSPVILIEFDHQRPVGIRHIDPSRTPIRQHIHVVVRTPNGNDYGKDLLRQHLEAHPH
jgi:hypothetical protein